MALPSSFFVQLIFRGDIQKMINYGRKIVADEKVAQKLHSMLQAQILAQVDYWTDRTNNLHKGFKWVYNSLEDWHKQFHWVSLSTLKRAFHELEKKGLLVVGNFNKFNYDRTKWYRVDYENLDKLILGSNKKIVAVFPNIKKNQSQKPLVQNEPMDSVKMTSPHCVKITQPIPEITETTTEINNTQSANKENKPTKSNKRYYEQFKKNQSTKPHYYYPVKKTVEKATDWSKHQAKKIDMDVTAMQEFFANLEAKVFSGQLQA